VSLRTFSFKTRLVIRVIAFSSRQETFSIGSATDSSIAIGKLSAQPGIAKSEKDPKSDANYSCDT